MTTSFTGSPKLHQGSLVAIDQATSKQTTIEFQYNPDTLTRKLTPQMVSGSHDRNEALRYKGPPQETISLVVEIDAADQLANNDSTAKDLGIHPALAALELLVYPKSSSVIDNEQRAAQGDIEIIPLEAPLILFVWGKKRLLPVRINSFSITEEAFDPDLNPINAKVSLDMQVLTYMDLPYSSKGGSMFMTHHKDKEQLAREKNSGSKPS